MPEKTTRRMRVIPEPKRGRTILKPEKLPAFKGNGRLSYVCGSCGSTIYRNLQYGQVQDLVIRCTCGSFNEIPTAHHAH